MDLNQIGDTLINPSVVHHTRIKQLHSSMESYKKANVLLGYFSQLRDYAIEYESLTTKLMLHRKEILTRYRDLLIDSHNDLYKKLLIPPIKNGWYTRGIQKYKKVKSYSIFYYRQKISDAIQMNDTDDATLRKLIDTIITLDRYYDIYDDTIGFFMDTNSKFDQIMKQTFPDRIHL